jgi:glycosyltransferase involved in cell wall biosynthesis
MEQGKRKAVAIFQANWPVHSQTTNLAMMFDEAGYDVDLFLFDAKSDFQYAIYEMQRLERYPRVRVHDLVPASSEPAPVAEPTFRGRFEWLVRRKLPPVAKLLAYVRPALRKARAALQSAPEPQPTSEDEFTPRAIVLEAAERMKAKTYHWLVGLEKNGLLWAGKVAEQTGIPYLYYNLELYVDDYARVRMDDAPKFKRLRSAERQYHSRSSGTIIQDPDRARVLFESNGLTLDWSKVFFLPVAALGAPYTERSYFFHEKFGLPRDCKIILYFGQIWEKRHLLELADIAQSFPPDWALVIHGWGQESSITNIRARDPGGRVLFSLDLISSADLPRALASADIGLALYSDEIKNDMLTAFSSEKMAIYMQSGVPFIGFDYPGYDRLAREDQCGRVISAMHELPGAIREILSAQAAFRRYAYRAFAQYYDFAANFRKMVERIRRL